METEEKKKTEEEEEIRTQTPTVGRPQEDSGRSPLASSTCREERPTEEPTLLMLRHSS